MPPALASSAGAAAQVSHKLRTVRVVEVTPRTSSLTAATLPECTRTLSAKGQVFHCSRDNGHAGGHRWYITERASDGP